MSEDVTKAEPAAEGVSEDQLRKAEAYVEAGASDSKTWLRRPS